MPFFFMHDGGVASVTYGSTQTSFNAAANATITFTGQAIGAAANNRHVVVALAMNIDQSLTVTVAGQACTKVVGVNTGLFFAELWITNAPVTTGTTANVVLSGTHTANARIASSTLAVYGVANPTTPASTGSDVASPYSIGLTIPTNGIAIGSCVVSVLTSWTWSSFTENVDGQLSPITYSAGSRATAGSITETVTPAAAGTAAFVAAAWGAA